MFRHDSSSGNGQRSPFDYYVRSVTTAALAMAIVGAALYAIVVQHSTSQVIVAWASGIIGVYFGYHISRNGGDVPRPPIESQVTVRKEPQSEAKIAIHQEEGQTDSPPAT